MTRAALSLLAVGALALLVGCGDDDGGTTSDSGGATADSGGGGTADGGGGGGDSGGGSTADSGGGGGADASSGSRASGGSGGKPGKTVQEINHGGKKRTFAVHVPGGYSDSKAVPLVIHFHGWRPLPAGIESEVAYVWSGVADKNVFIAVAPEGVSCPELNPKGQPYGCFKDPAFVKALLSYLGKQYNIDLSRVYLSGHSGGAYFAQLSGIGGADTYAASVGFSGGCVTSGPNYVNSCARYKALSDGSKRKMPHFVIHSSKDQVVPVSWSVNLINAVLKPGKHPTKVYPAQATDAYNGGKYGHSVDATIVPQVWTWLTQYTTP